MAEETRAERSVRRRQALLEDYNEKYRGFLLFELENYPNQEEKLKDVPKQNMLRNAVRKLDMYIQGLCKQKPQESSFYISVALEWQRRELQRVEEFIARKPKST
jgi:hypothetical protein